VGAGISGLAAAWFFRKAAGPSARIAILDNHDDFGGHARPQRVPRGRPHLVGYGGAFAIDSPAPYSAVANSLLTELAWRSRAGRAWSRARSTRRSVWAPPCSSIARPSAADGLLAAPERGAASGAGDADAWPAFLAKAPLSESAPPRHRAAGQDAGRLSTRARRRRKEGPARARQLRRFSVRMAGCHPDVLPFFQARPHSLYGLGSTRSRRSMRGA
jgi:spermidine dehydrogenase